MFQMLAGGSASDMAGGAGSYPCTGTVSSAYVCCAFCAVSKSWLVLNLAKIACKYPSQNSTHMQKKCEFAVDSSVHLATFPNGILQL